MSDLYLLVKIGPLGFTHKPAFVTWLDTPHVDLASATHGEGQALLFRLERYDCSTAFAEAIKSGQLVTNYRDETFQLVRIPKQRKRRRL